MDFEPLAEKLRPKNIDDVVGQKHIIGQGKIITQIISNKIPTSLIFWGPPGTGKTTLARIIAQTTDSEFIELSAVTASKADVVKSIDLAKMNQRLGSRTIVFVDEIHRFNKAQQDAFLPHIENGTIVFIGATTENPSFEVINALISRSKVVVLEPLSKEDISIILQKALKSKTLPVKILPKASQELIAQIAEGDARIALGILELAINIREDKITPEIVKSAAQKKIPNYDKKGDGHYDTISAFIKSMRASKPDDATYYMARMLNAGEDPKFIARRMVIFASEDIGLAGNGALSLAVATFQAVERIGLPECRYNLFHCCIALSRSAKSREISDMMAAAIKKAEDFPNQSIPIQLLRGNVRPPYDNSK